MYEPQPYELQYRIIFLGCQILDFTGNSHAQKINKAQTKGENIMDVPCNLLVSTGSGENFVL